MAGKRLCSPQTRSSTCHRARALRACGKGEGTTCSTPPLSAQHILPLSPHFLLCVFRYSCTTYPGAFFQENVVILANVVPTDEVVLQYNGWCRKARLEEEHYKPMQPVARTKRRPDDHDRASLYNLFWLYSPIIHLYFPAAPTRR